MKKISGSWMREDGVVRVMGLLEQAGHQAFFVGGCVRDALVGRPIFDIDISTDAHPKAVIKLARDAGLQAIPTGIDHGTVTVIAGRPLEITTFRRDIDTDGRRAVVAFARSIDVDAERRDLTFNAIYADVSGALFDPVGGVADLDNRRVRFVGNADQRIREDYLRSLRYFRFMAWFGDPVTGPDPDALAAIGSNLAGIDTLSKERVGVEMRKLLSAPDPAPALATMEHCGLLGAVLAGSDSKPLGPLVHLEGLLDVEPDPIRRLAVLTFGDPSQDLRLSKKEARDHRVIADAARDGLPPHEVGYRFGPDRGMDAILVRAALMGTGVQTEDLADIQAGAAKTFPIRAADLPEFAGPALGQKLKALETEWIASKFTMTRDALLS